jgi:hypothetical protein
VVAYIIQLAKEIVIAATAPCDVERMLTLIRVLPEELNRLDPRDFLPSARYDFVLARASAREWGTGTNSNFSEAVHAPVIKQMAERVVSTLKHYGADGSRVVSRSFAFIKDSGLRQIIERDYRELRLKVFPSRAWKSTVILAGSIMEAILFDQLARDSSIEAKAKASPKAPKDKAGTVLNLVAGDWSLFALIEVSVDIRVLPTDRAKSFDQVLRDYRNFVHPKKELRAQHPCTEAEALMSVGALEGVCNILK